MEASVINIILSILLLLVLPVFVGNGLCGLLKSDRTLSKSFVIGQVGIWALCQVVTVPLVLLKADFRIVVVLLSILVMVLCIYGVWKKYFVTLLLPTETVGQKLALTVMMLAFLALIITSTVLQHTDADDSRFVVNAVDIYRTNRMYLTNPATGQALSVWQGELIKDVTSPWAVYMAYCALLTGTHPTIMAHTILPVMLLLMACCVFWMFSEMFFDKDITHRCIFVCFVLLLNVYGYCSLYTAETFLMTRIWQGKAVVAGVGVPLLLWEFFQIYHKEKKKENYVLLLVTEIALCLLSGMGIIIGAIMAGCFGLLYGIAKRQWKVTVVMWLTAVPNALYYGISLLLKG